MQDPLSQGEPKVSGTVIPSPTLDGDPLDGIVKPPRTDGGPTQTPVKREEPSPDDQASEEGSEGKTLEGQDEGEIEGQEKVLEGGEGEETAGEDEGEQPPDVETLRQQNAELQRRVEELDRLRGTQGAELGVAREQAQRLQQQMQEQARREYAQVTQTVGNLIEQSQLAETPEEKGNLVMQAIGLASQYNNNQFNTARQTALDNERSLFESHPHLKEVQASFDQYCNEMGSDGITVRMNPRMLARWYQSHWNESKGRTLDPKKVKEDAKKQLQQERERKKKAEAPTTSGPTRKPADKASTTHKEMEEKFGPDSVD